jgi:REP element-mobilizing transposase RayT
MPTSLTKDQRSLLSRVTLEAREVAETAARAALENLAVHEGDYRGHMTVEQRQLRNRLRARGRALGDRLDQRTSAQSIDHLAESAAYEHWHRLLFTRFLAENHLLHTDEANGAVPVTLDECSELAPELGARDGFELACRFASEILPGVFRRDDPVLELRLAPNHEVQLRQLLDQLPAELFRADDALGWTYQFWQAKRKDEINRSGVKIGADELPAVTQLFTEDYMVEFLLHNSIGAWWAGKESARLAPGIQTEDEARRAVSLPPRGGLPGIDWTYLRFVKELGRPAEAAEAGASHPCVDLGAGRPESFETPPDGASPFVNPFAEIEITTNRLPHWQQGEAWIFVTWRLADSLPADKLRQWQEEKDAWLACHPEPWDEPTRRNYHEWFTQRIEDWLDAGHGACILRQPKVRKIVSDALGFFDGERYELGHWVVMPNHVHVLFRPSRGHRLSGVLQSWKSFTAKEINKQLGRTGPVWQEDYWDRLVRNERHLDACQRYIAGNPVKAGLAANDWSDGVGRARSAPFRDSGRDAPAPSVPSNS